MCLDTTMATHKTQGGGLAICLKGLMFKLSAMIIKRITPLPLSADAPPCHGGWVLTTFFYQEFIDYKSTCLP